MINKKHTCPKCGTVTNSFYCPHCATIFEYPSFVEGNEKRRRALTDFVKEIVSQAKKQATEISSAIDSSSIRKSIYRKYYERIAYLQKLCSNKTTQSYYMNGGSNIFEQMNAFAQKCEFGECQIAVVGTVKAGKSMLINALMGKEIASSYPTPETASVTKFRSSERGNYVIVRFYSSHEWQVLWDSVNSVSQNATNNDENESFLKLYRSLHAETVKSKLLNKADIEFKCESLSEMKEIIDKYTSARFAEHFFAKEVEVGLSDFFAPSNVVIVDTPGLDDPVPYRADITRNYLHHANVVLLCVCANSPVIRYTELDQLNGIFGQLRYNKERIITFATKIDDVEGDMLAHYKKHTLPSFLSYLSRSTLYGSSEVTLKSLHPVSAYYFLLTKKALDEPSIFSDKSDEAKSFRKSLNKMVRSCFDVPEREDLIEELGEEEGEKAYKSPRVVFDERNQELLEMTQIPKVRQILIDGPINNANRIILSDIKEMYQLLCNDVQKIATELSEHRARTIELSQRSDVARQIAELENRIKEEKKSQKKIAELLSKAFSKMEQDSRRILNQIKK